MNHHSTPAFWHAHARLPKQNRTVADRAFEILKSDPTHTPLALKPVGRFWSVRVGLHYRALAVRKGDTMVWFWIGSHADYDRLLG